jgi:RNA polymerase sigma factor (sigma-70 family)
MPDAKDRPTLPPTALLYHFCRSRLPRVVVPPEAFERRLAGAFEQFRARRAREGGPADWKAFLANFHPLDWYLAIACLEGQSAGWEQLFASRANRSDRLLVDALRARATRLFARDTQRQEDAIADFWGFLLAGEREGATPILARYDGQRPLVPWLIRVFQNKHLTELRQVRGQQLLTDDELDAHDLPLPNHGDERWHEEFRSAARVWLDGLKDADLLLLGLRLRYRLSQREVANVLGIHEGNVSRQLTKLRDNCLKQIGDRLRRAGWMGDDLAGFVYTEMDSLLLDEPRLAADRLAAILAAKGKSLNFESA